MLSKSEKRLKLRVWLVILASLTITFSALFWSYKSFIGLNNSIQQITEPNKKLTLINNLVQDFISAENNIQSYIITGNILLARKYEAQITEVRSSIQQLKIWSAQDTVQLQKIDSLEQTLDKKLLYLNSFLLAKKERQSTAFTELALDRINANTNDSLKLKREAYKRSDSSGNLKPLKTQKVVAKRETTNGIWGGIKKLFGSTVVTYDTIISETYSLSALNNNTNSDNTSLSTDSALIKVKEILTQAGDLESEMQRNLSTKELALLNQDQVFMSEIKSLIDDLKRNEKSLGDKKKEELLRSANRSTKIIASIGLSGILIGIILLSLIMKDITKASFFRGKLEKEKVRAEKLAKVKEEFLANMSHEIRTPLNSILGFSRLMKETSLSNEQETFIKAVNTSSDYLIELVNDILDYSKIESGKLQLVETPFSTKELADNTFQFFKLAAKQKSLDLHINVEEDVPERLIGDVFRIKQIINNLLSNALKFTKEGSIKVSFSGHWYKEVFYFSIQVTDTGHGIEPNKQDLIFESFTQENAFIANKFGGTGLGLGICKNLAKAMGGTISLESQKNKGTTFTVKIPLQKSDQIDTSTEEFISYTEQFFNAKVLVVEDDQFNAILIKTILNKYVDTVVILNDAEAAFDYMQENVNTIDLIFTDIKLPTISGDEFASRLRSLKIGTPIVALTAHVNISAANKILARGVNKVITKPYEEKDIVLTLREFLGSEKEGSKPKLKAIENSHSNNSIDLSDLNNFARGSQDALNEIIEELITNNSIQIKSFNQYLKNKSWNLLADLAHQMTPTYDHLKLFSISEALRTIELHAQLKNFKMAENIAIELLPKLRKYHKKISKLDATSV